MSSETLVLYGNEEVRTTVIDKQMWWALVDICRVIGIKNNHDVAKKLDEDEKAGVDLIYPSSNGIAQKRKYLMINEPGLYHILLTSRSEKAKPFRRWVTHDVLPNIRKHGYYKIPNDDRRIIAYKSIAKSLGLNGVSELDDKYGKMPLYRLELCDRELRYEAELKQEREEVIKKYPYSSDEVDKMFDGYGCAITNLRHTGADLSKYMITLRNGEERFNEKFIKYARTCYH